MRDVTIILIVYLPRPIRHWGPGPGLCVLVNVRCSCSGRLSLNIPLCEDADRRLDARGCTCVHAWMCQCARVRRVRVNGAARPPESVRRLILMAGCRNELNDMRSIAKVNNSLACLFAVIYIVGGNRDWVFAWYLKGARLEWGLNTWVRASLNKPSFPVSHDTCVTLE